MSFVLEERPYQNRAIHFLKDMGGSGAVRAPTGAGKCTIGLLTVREVGFKRLLILVPRYSALLAWKKALADLAIVDPGDIAVVEKWPRKRRLELWENPATARIVVALYPTMRNDFLEISAEESGFDYIICDEAHKAAKNPNTQTFKRLKVVCRRRKKIFLTATMQSKGPQDLWGILHLLSPKVFSSYYGFVNRYCIMEEDEYGRKPIGVKKSTLKELKQRMYGFICNITDKEINGWVPKRVRKILTVHMDRKVSKLYNNLFTTQIGILPNGDAILTPNVLAKYTEVRKLLCCPALLHPSLGVGNAFLEALEHAENNDKHVVIYSDFVEQFPIWEKHLKSLDIPCYSLKGGISARDLSTIIDQFSRHKESEQLSVLLCSIKFAESFDLLSTLTGYFVGYSWSQIENYQAEGRLTRGAKTHCNFFYMSHENTIDTDMLQVLDNNVRTTNITMPTNSTHEELM
jgi:superfamily II DNA or RNA helicase